MQLTLTPAGTPIIGLDTSRRPLLLVVTTPDNCVPGAVVPETWESFESLPDFCRYWDAHWRDSGVQVAVPTDHTDPLRARDWLITIGQALEPYEWLGYKSHLRSDLTLQNIGVDSCYQRAYVLALYACHRLQTEKVVTTLWVKLLEACCMLEDIRHSVHRLAAATRPEASPEMEVPF